MAAPETCLSFDPGPTKTGWCLLRTGIRARPTFEAGGEIASDVKAIEKLLSGIGCHAGLVAVETPEGYIHEHARGAQVLETAKVAERIALLASGAGRLVAQLSAQRWRRQLGIGGRGVPGDAAVKGALRVLVADFPKRSNCHVRDAMGVGWVALTHDERMRGVIARAMGGG